MEIFSSLTDHSKKKCKTDGIRMNKWSLCIFGPKAVIAFICLWLSLFFFSYESNAQTRESIVREHVKAHSCIPEYVVDELYIHEYVVDKGTVVTYSMWLNFFEFEGRDGFPAHTLINVRIGSDNQILNCTCNDYTIENYIKDAEYYYAVKSSVAAAAEWEKIYGPQEGWDAKMNSLFEEMYHYPPNMTYEGYFENVSHIIPNEEKLISVEKARNISDAILYEHLAIELRTLSSLTVGSTYHNTDPASYWFTYYSKNMNNTFQPQYFVVLQASDGKCILASRGFTQQELDQLHKHPESFEEINQKTYWSEVDYWKSFFGWENW